ncbi:MAG: VirB3 family type IV secretion system protein [Treponema sp.]|jgi:type IV secretory pathway VirB3-like protein|nr:VirB3 family type IV secretion system protein [Treponema sp.]
MSDNSSKNTKKIIDFAIPVRRSVIHRDLMLGIPFVPFILLAFVTIFMVFSFQQYVFLVITAASWFMLRQITKSDEWLLDIVLSSLLQPDELR